ncbi:Phosphoglucomutase, chloroplastic [Vitis vinifera]|uniref:Phosphoglucomutase, chloroplastic n=1 Tax=Vitis vinifera TaxID=29760 RepID=A0A438EER4_VITVI|nr:Phosphoglucomutase, chloroplastic [Vitis vinifera]
MLPSSGTSWTSSRSTSSPMLTSKPQQTHSISLFLFNSFFSFLPHLDILYFLLFLAFTHSTAYRLAKGLHLQPPPWQGGSVLCHTSHVARSYRSHPPLQQHAATSSRSKGISEYPWSKGVYNMQPLLFTGWRSCVDKRSLRAVAASVLSPILVLLHSIFFTFSLSKLGNTGKLRKREAKPKKTKSSMAFSLKMDSVFFSTLKLTPLPNASFSSRHFASLSLLSRKFPIRRLSVKASSSAPSTSTANSQTIKIISMPQSRLKAKRLEPAVYERRCLFVSIEFAENLDEKKIVKVFMEENYLANWIQALFNSLPPEDYKDGVLVLGGDGRYFNWEAAQIIIKIAAGNGVGKILVGK